MITIMYTITPIYRCIYTNTILTYPTPRSLLRNPTREAAPHCIYSEFGEKGANMWELWRQKGPKDPKRNTDS